MIMIKRSDYGNVIIIAEKLDRNHFVCTNGNDATPFNLSDKRCSGYVVLLRRQQCELFQFVIFNLCLFLYLFKVL